MTLVGNPVFGSLSLKWATILRSVPNLSSHMVEVVLRTEYGRSYSPIIRLIKLLFPELVSPVSENKGIMHLTFPCRIEYLYLYFVFLHFKLSYTRVVTIHY